MLDPQDERSVLQAIDASTLPDLMRRVLDPNASAQAREMAARGMIPAAPADTLLLLYQFTLAADPKLQRTAMDAMANQPLDVVLGALKEIRHPGVLHRLATVRDEPTLRDRIVDHRLTHELTLVAIATAADQELTERIAVNESRLLRSPIIIEALYLNPKTRMSTIERLIELARRNGITFERVPALNDLKEVPKEEKAEEEESSEYREYLDRSVAEAEEEGADETVAEARRRAAEEEAEAAEAEPEKKKAGNRQAMIDQMSLSEKVRLATLGSAADREYLIRSPNRMVHMAVVTSPKVRFADILAWSANKGMPDGVINFIAGHRLYRKSYPIIVNLANNPKTHLKEAIRMLQSLQASDLKAVGKNRNVKPQVARMAKVMLEQKEKARRK